MSNTLYVAWRAGGDGNGQWGPVGRLDRLGTGYRFRYTRGARTLPGFQPFPGMLDLEGVYEADTLLPLFANRLLSASRPEYPALRVWGDLDDDAADPIAVLSVTEGRRATDSYECFPEPRRDADGRYVGKFFLHGLRHRHPEALERVKQLQPGARLALRPETNNPFDPRAVAVDLDGVHLGYAPRYLARDIRSLGQSGRPEEVQLSVVRVNHDAPLQQRLLCRIEAPWPQSFQPCAQDDYRPISRATDSLAA